MWREDAARCGLDQAIVLTFPQTLAAAISRLASHLVHVMMMLFGTRKPLPFQEGPRRAYASTSPKFPSTSFEFVLLSSVELHSTLYAQLLFIHPLVRSVAQFS